MAVLQGWRLLPLTIPTMSKEYVVIFKNRSSALEILVGVIRCPLSQSTRGILRNHVWPPLRSPQWPSEGFFGARYRVSKNLFTKSLMERSDSIKLVIVSISLVFDGVSRCYRQQVTRVDSCR